MKTRDACPTCGHPATLLPSGTSYDLTLAAHDMRALLTIALGHVELLETAVVGEPVSEASRLLRRVEATSRALWRLVGLVDEIRDVARLQVGHALALRREEVDLGALIQAVVAEYRMEAGRPRARVRTAEKAVRVRGDRARLERVLHNLLDNAVKYSPLGTAVDVDVQIQEQRAVITVRDQGRGIPAEDLPRIFRPFYRASTARDVAGSGIGLAGAKAIIEDHHGQITVQSTVGQGTTVTVMLPCLMADP